MHTSDKKLPITRSHAAVMCRNYITRASTACSDPPTHKHKVIYLVVFLILEGVGFVHCG